MREKLNTRWRSIELWLLDIALAVIAYSSVIITALVLSSYW